MRAVFGLHRKAVIALCSALVAAIAVIVPASPASATPPGVSNILIVLDGSAATKTMALSWGATAYTPFNSYEIHSGNGANVVDWYDYISNSATTSYNLTGWGNKTTPGSFVLGNTYSIGMDIAEGAGVYGPQTFANVKMVATPTVTATATSSTSLSFSWTAADASDPFVSYDIFLAPTSYAGSLSNCWATWEGTRTNNSKTLTSVPSACGGGTIQPNTSYKVGVRTIQKTGNPSVWTKIGESTIKTVPTQCDVSSGPNEAFCSVYPNGFVKNSSWPVAEQGTPFVVNGANTKYGPRLYPSTWDTQKDIDIITNIKGAGGPNQLNTVRVNLDWARFQTWNGSAAVMNTTALTELDKVVQAGVDNGMYIILVPVHIRQPGGQCNDSGSPLYTGYFNVPRWAWNLVDPSLTLNSAWCDDWPSTYDDKVDDALLLTQARDYFRAIANRYSDYSTPTKAALSRQVIGLDLVNEMTADGGGSTEQDKVLSTYQTIITDLRANTTATKKIMIGEVGHGDTSLKQNISDLQALAGASSNIVMSFHDYFGGSSSCGGTVPTNATYGQGYSGSGFVTGHQRTDGVARPYTCGTTEEKSQHQAYVNQMAGWFSQAQLPMYIGEYGVYNSCWGNNQAEANLYAQDTKSVYDNVTMDVNGTPTAVAVGRTWWSHGWATDGNAMELRRSASGCASQAQGTYFAHAAYL